jgi:drug/metabolite transporter (DMT)-like permease
MQWFYCLQKHIDQIQYQVMSAMFRERKFKGMIAILGASVMWAIEPILAKLSYQSTDFWNTFATRTFFSLLVIALYVFVTRQRIKIETRLIPPMIYLSVVSTLVGDLMYIFALTRVPVVNAVILGHMQPIFVVIFGYIVLKQDRITVYDYLGIAFMIIAGIMVTTRTIQNLASFRLGTVGDLYVLIATVAWATTAIVARKYLRGVPAGVIAFYRFGLAGVAYGVYMVIAHTVQISSWFQIALGGVIGVGTILYYQGIRLIKAAQVSALELSTPLFSTCLAYLFLRETISTMQFIGVVLLLGGIYFLSKRE